MKFVSIRSRIGLLSLALLFFLPAQVQAQREEIKTGKVVQFDYTLTVDGEVIETTEGKEPIKYLHGQGTIIPGLEKALEGSRVGDTETVTIPPEQAYGEINKEAIKDIPKANFPRGMNYRLGSVIELEDEEGNTYPAVIWDIKEDTVTVNFNHPLAGKTLTFDVTIVSIEDL